MRVLAGCGVQPADIVFIVDATKSVGASNFVKMKDFIKNTVSGFNIGPNDVQVGMFTYTGKANSEFHLNTFNNKQVFCLFLLHLLYPFLHFIDEFSPLQSL